MARAHGSANGLAGGEAGGLDFRVKREDWGQADDASVGPYPQAPINGGVEEILHGVKVRDPWRGLENEEAESTQRFIDEQNEVSIPYLTSHPLRQQVEEAVRVNMDSPRCSIPKRVGQSAYTWTWNSGSLARDVVVRSDDLNRNYGQTPSGYGGTDGPEVVFDLNKEQGISLYMDSWSPDGRYYGAVLQESGSDWQKLRTIDTTTGKAVEKDLEHCKFTFGVCWVGSDSFLYKRQIACFAVANNSSTLDTKFGILYHRLGDKQEDDVCVWEGTGPLALQYIMGRPHVLSGDGHASSGRRRWLMLDIYKSVSPGMELFIVELPAGEIDGHALKRLWADEARWLTKGFTGGLTYAGTDDRDTHYFSSTAGGFDAGHVVALDLSTWTRSKPGETLKLREVVPERADKQPIQHLQLFANHMLVVTYIVHACASVHFVDARTGKELGETDAKGSKGGVKTAEGAQAAVPVPEEEIEKRLGVIIPKHAAVTHLAARAAEPDVYLTIETYISQPYILRGVLRADGSAVDLSVLGPTRSSESGSRAPPLDLICEHTFYESHDKTQIPMFICRPADLDLSQPHPTIVHGYGGFATPMIPHYDPFFFAFMRNLRGIVVVAGIRGGGEYGKAWHEAAMGQNRRVAYDDLCWAAKHIQSAGLTTTSLTAVFGTSNGGLLSTAVVMRNPELFAAALPDVPLTDMIRYTQFTLGRFWASEYGDPSDPVAFPHLFELSPLHNVASPEEKPYYPAVLVTTGDHDTRVVPAHSLKYLAEMQRVRGENGGRPILGRIYRNAGHEPGARSTKERVGESADRLIFLLRNLRYPRKP